MHHNECKNYTILKELEVLSFIIILYDTYFIFKSGKLFNIA